MAELNLSSATTTNLAGTVPDFIVKAKALDAVSPNQDETYLYFDKAPQYFGYYHNIPEIYAAANALATWSVGIGWTCNNPLQTVILKYIRGAGKDTFDSIVWNHQVTKIVVGDAFAEIKRNDNEDIVLNIIPISPERVRVVFGKSGLIKRYDVWNGTKWHEVEPKNMLHSHNKRIGDSMGGNSQIEAAKKIIDARNEALDDERIIKHRDKALGIAYYETDKAGKIAYANQQIEKAVKNGEMVGLPKGTVEILPYPSRSSEDRTGWIQYLEASFLSLFGVPKSIISSDGISEVGGKMGHVVFQVPAGKEALDLENELWNQQQIYVKFNRPPSLGGLQPSNPAEDFAKNTGQTNIQPNDSVVNLNRE